MHVIAINGGPRKNRNGAALLAHAISGAQATGATAETINLYDLRYTGCKACYTCKRKGVGPGHCHTVDDLSPVLEKVMRCDALLLSSPVFLGNVSGMMRAFLERLVFSNFTYDDPARKTFERDIPSAFFFTLNAPAESRLRYADMFSAISHLLIVLGSHTEYYASFDVLQFDDYSWYDAKYFDAQHKERMRKEQFPRDCEAAREIGARLCTGPFDADPLIIPLQRYDHLGLK